MNEQLRLLLQGGDKRSVGKVDEVITLVEQRPALLPGLISLIADEDELVRMRAADAAEKLTHIYPGRLQPHKAFLLKQLEGSHQQEVQWHLVAMISRMELTGVDRQIIEPVLYRYVEESPSKIVQAFSLQALFDISAEDAPMRTRVVELLETMTDNSSAAVRTRAKNLLALVAKQKGKLR